MVSLFAASLLALSIQGHAAPAGAASTTAALKYDVPTGWTTKAPSSAMRLADFVLPKVEGDTEDATLTIYHFGAQAGGGVQANLDRWVSQMSQPDGKDSKDLAKTSTAKQKNLSLTVIDLGGTYVAETFPGSGQKLNKPGFQMKAAVIEGPGGPYYIKLVGPAKTIAKWDASVQTFMKSLRTE